MRIVKRTLLVLLALLVVALGILFAAGRREGTGAMRAQVEIPRPPSVVYEWLVTPALRTRWYDGLVESRALEAGGPRAGARYHEVVASDGSRTEMETTFTVVEPPRRLDERIAGDGFTIDVRILLDSIASGTRVRVESQSRFGSPVLRLLAPLFMGEAERRLQRDLESLRDHAVAGR